MEAVAGAGPPVRRLLAGVTMVAFAVPTVAYFWFIHRHGVNMIWGDQWNDVEVIRHWRTGHLGLGILWQQHNEARIFFPNLLVVLLAATTHFNVVFEMYLSAVLLTGAIGLLIVTHRLRTASTHWIVYVPVALLMFSLVQFANTLWGFQVAWYIVLFALAATLFFLDRPRLDRLVLVAAM